MASSVERWLVLGNPGNRRVTLFQEALVRQGHAPAEVLAWRDVLDGAPLPPDGPRRFRIDSFGEDFEVYRRLLALGGDAEAREHPERRGEVLHPRVAHDGFLSALERLGSQLEARPGFSVLNVPGEIAELFDKRRTSRRYEAAGLPVPARLDPVPLDAPSLLDAIRARGWSQAYVKLSSGSSASCLAQVTVAPEVRVVTSLEWDAPRWFNTLKVRFLRRPEAVDRALGFILAQGAHVEEGHPKARLDGENFDCRVLCVAGEPAFVVVRCSPLPITNLHLGGRRGDLDRLLAVMPPAAWASAMDTCRGVARLYRSLHVGIDLMFTPGFDRHLVLEANAFGDLLPGLTRDGLSVYEWEIRAATGGSVAAPTTPA